MAEEHTLVEERFFELMKRLRKLELDTQSCDAAVSPAQMSLLDFIAALPGCGVQDIADGMRLTPPTVSVGVRRMEESNLVERKPNPLDGRSVQFFLTRRGQALQRQIQNSHRQKFRRLLAGLVPQEQETLLQLLERALQAAEAENSNLVD
ncbi:MAG: MarR family winged helix-turn-helix transcriptional regulator [Chloroflexi bacterium]|nr:MarR family winged helix-turn-helix transcriptional regulator [Chloroflexota bacterium]